MTVSSLDKEFLCITEETQEDGQLINAVVKIIGDGPILENSLENVPLRFEGKLEVRQVLESRLLRCKYMLISLP